MLKKSADSGYADSMYTLATYHEKGVYLEKDHQKAIEFYESAAKLNHSSSINNLALYYDYGKYVKKDMKKAIELCKPKINS